MIRDLLRLVCLQPRLLHCLGCGLKDAVHGKEISYCLLPSNAAPVNLCSLSVPLTLHASSLLWLCVHPCWRCTRQIPFTSAINIFPISPNASLSCCRKNRRYVVCPTSVQRSHIHITLLFLLLLQLGDSVPRVMLVTRKQLWHHHTLSHHASLRWCVEATKDQQRGVAIDASGSPVASMVIWMMMMTKLFWLPSKSVHSHKYPLQLLFSLSYSWHCVSLRLLLD